MRKSLVIFDCDGVLVDSEPLSNRALVDCLALHGVAMDAREALASFRGRKLADCLREIEASRGCKLPDTFEASFRALMGKFFEAHLKPIEGIAGALERVPQLKCVASNGPLNKTTRNLEITGLAHHFGANVFSAYEIQKWKPEPALFLHACAAMGSAPADTVVVEDSDSGVAAALAGGFRVLAYGMRDFRDPRIVSFLDMAALPGLVHRLLPTK